MNLIRQFLHHASFHTVEEIQAFTAQWVPNPRWVRTEAVTIPDEDLTSAANALIAELGHKGIDRVGGKNWWQWRRDNAKLKAEWIEMRSDHNRRKKTGEKCTRVMLYVHGGAYFFGSVDEHRYQMQRHARKLRARVLAPRYRLSPQFPFPCGLHDCLAVYLYLLKFQDPTTIVLAGDSAGGGMVLSLLVTLRDQGLPLPAGAILISPWVDLTHSFPSVSEGSSFDYIPSHGFMQRPSLSWPPPNADDLLEITKHAIEKKAAGELPRLSTHQDREQAAQDAVQGFSIDGPDRADKEDTEKAGEVDPRNKTRSAFAGEDRNLSIVIDDKVVEIKDQIQMYATNQLISHPLVSPILQPSLGGLPPLLILTGGGEVLRDEQVYLAHKAADPSRYPPSEAYIKEHPEARDLITKYKGTNVQIQVWEDLCHVAPTLSFTRPAKYMFRSIAQFGAWALARAQKTSIEIMDDDDVSVISSDSDAESTDEGAADGRVKVEGAPAANGKRPAGLSSERVGKAGDPLPAFHKHMIRQTVDRHGTIYPMGPPQKLAGCSMPPNDVGVIKRGPVEKWMLAKKQWESKFANERRRVQKRRIQDMSKGYLTFSNDEVPPPSALAGRRSENMPKEAKIKRSWGMSLWSLWGSSHDEKTVSADIALTQKTLLRGAQIEREEKADKEPETTDVQPDAADGKKHAIASRSRSHHRAVSDLGQANEDEHVDENTTAAELLRRRAEAAASNADRGHLSPTFVPLPKSPLGPPSAQEKETPLVLAGTNVTLDSPTATRPKADGVAFPFKLGRSLLADGANASTVTLKSERVATPQLEAGEEKILGVNGAEHDSAAVDTERPGTVRTETVEKDKERPPMERFETAQES